MNGGRSSVSGLKVTVFGATGFLGRYLVNKLGQIGSQMVIPYRGNEYDAMHLKPLGDLGQINLQSFHLKDYDGIVSAVKSSDIVVNLIGQDRETRNFNARDVHVTGALNIAKACAESGVKRFIHVSPALASSNSQSKILKSRAEAENALRRDFSNSIIVRASTLFGNEDRFLNAIGAFTYLPFGFGVVDHGRAKRSPLYVGDLAEGLTRLISLRDELVSGKTFDLFGPREYTYHEVIEIFCYLACRPTRITSMSPFVLNLYGRLYPEWRRFLFTRDLIKQMSEDEVKVSGSNSWEDLGMSQTGLRTLESDALPFVRCYRHVDDYSTILPPLLPEQE